LLGAARKTFTLDIPGALKFLFYGCTLFTFVHLFFHHVFETSAAYGASMLPTMEMSGTLLGISKSYRRGKDIEVGDIVAANHPMFPKEMVVKRVIGMPGDFVLADSVDSSGRMIQVWTSRFLAGLTTRLTGISNRYREDTAFFPEITIFTREIRDIMAQYR
jgi:signal peptidase I